MVFRAARAALELDIPVLRCTFRGVGNSGNFRATVSENGITCARPGLPSLGLPSGEASSSAESWI